MNGIYFVRRNYRPDWTTPQPVLKIRFCYQIRTHALARARCDNMTPSFSFPCVTNQLQ